MTSLWASGLLGLGCKDLSTTGKMLQPFHSEYNIPGSLSELKDRPIMVTMATHLAEATTPAVSSSRSCCHQIFEASGVTSGDNHEEYLQSQEYWGHVPTGPGTTLLAG